MKRTMNHLLVMIWVLSATSVLAADRVTVIPMSSTSAMGADKQVQYNDNGKLAGAEMYYDKSTERFGMGPAAPSCFLDVKDYRADWLVRIHNTSTHSQARGLLVRSNGGDILHVQKKDGTTVFGVDQYGNSYTYGSAIITKNVGIGTLPTFTLSVAGTAGKTGGGTWSDLSDQRLKKNIGKLEGALEKITQLRGVSYEWVNPGDHGMRSGPLAGFLAQELEAVFPAWVTEVEPVGKDKALVGENEKVKSLYLPVDFNAYLIEAIKELKAENDSLKQLVCADHPEASLCQ